MEAHLQLSPDHGDIDKAIAELERALPIEALKSVLAHREKRHGKTAELRRVLKLWKARQLVSEADAA
jgi:hypothetical protein